MELKADASFDSPASATFGATARLELGDASISWDPTNHWRFTRPEPKLTWSLPLVAPLPLCGGGSLMYYTIGGTPLR